MGERSACSPVATAPPAIHTSAWRCRQGLTLSEIALGLRVGLPVIGLATWGLTLSGEPVEAFPIAQSPEQASRLALDAAKRSINRP